MFNLKKPAYSDRQHHSAGSPVYVGDYSYIESVKWTNFKTDIGKYLDLAGRINEKVDDYKIIKSID